LEYDVLIPLGEIAAAGSNWRFGHVALFLQQVLRWCRNELNNVQNWAK
jgi:hypothetical protein